MLKLYSFNSPLQIATVIGFIDYKEVAATDLKHVSFSGTMDRALGTKEKKKPKLKPTGIANNSIKQGDKSSSKVKSKKIPGASSRRDETPLPLQNDYPNQWLEDESSIVDTGVYTEQA